MMDQIAHTASELPTGTITFVFTDIEGSTRLWEQYPQAMPAALARHDAILREAMQAHGGVIFKTVGDGVHAAFPRAADALVAALAAQRALHAEPWGSVGSLRVRMALHTGAAELRDGDYFGGPLNRIARILALGHGGQILLSHATHDLVADTLPDDATLHALGAYPLKDLTRPESLFQLVSPDLPSDFPSLHAAILGPTPAPPQPFHLLTTKLYAPPARPQLVARPRLLARLDAGLSGKLTLLSAPAGFGKTTLLSAWLASLSAEGRELRAETLSSLSPQSPLPSPQVAWVSLDAADSDPLRFWSYVIAALDLLQPNSGATALTLLQSPQPPPIEAVLTSLLNALSALPANAILVLDDYHVIDTPPIHSAMVFLLDHLPPQLHLVITTRADPPLPMTRLRVTGQLTELRATDLRFTADETAAFLTDFMGLPLSAEDIHALDARTEGWVAGLQLAALAMRDRSDLAGFIRAFSGSNRFVVDYLAEEVLSRLPSHLQTFVLQTAILDRLCGPLCDAVLGVTSNEVQGTSSEIDALATRHSSLVTPDAYSQVVLEQLERANLFLVSLDDERRWYRYHHLFAEVLRARLNSGATAAELATLHQRASMWYERQGLIGEAVHFAFQVNDIKRATALVERHGLRVMLDQNEVFQIQTWIERLPHELIIARPRLTIIAGFILAFWLQYDAVERLLEEAAPAFNLPERDPNSVGELLALRSTLTRLNFDVAATLTLAHQALTQLDSTNYALLAVVNLNIGMVLLERNEIAAANQAFSEALAFSEREGEWIGLATLEKIMRSQFRQGQIRQMLATSEALIKRSARRGAGPIPAAGMGYAGVAEVLYEWNNLDGAMQAVTQALDLLRRGMERLLLVRAYAVLARIHQAQGNEAEALATLHQCEEWFVQNRIPALKTLRLIFAYHLGPLVRYDNPAATLEPVPEHASLDESEASYIQRLILAQQWLTHEQSGHDSQLLDKACTTLEQVLAEVEARGWGRYQIKALLLLGLAYQKRQDLTRAEASMERALSLAQPDGYVRTFVDEGAHIFPLLSQVARSQSPVVPYATKLLAAFPTIEAEPSARRQESLPSGRLAQPAALAEPLSSRELEILLLIADGLSNQSIADTLIIAISTVKRHVNNIYGKLAVQSRTQALLRARELNLL